MQNADRVAVSIVKIVVADGQYCAFNVNNTIIICMEQIKAVPLHRL